MRSLSHLAIFALCTGSLSAIAPVGIARAQEQAPEPTFPVVHRFEAGLGLRFMPVGWFDLADVTHRSFRAYPAFGLAPFIDYRLNRFFSIGLSPEITLNVIPNREDYHVGEMLLCNARLQVRYPNPGRFEPYAMFTGGYSIIWRAEASSATGPVAGGALGIRVKFAKRHAVFAEVSYQKGFQTADGGAYGPSYLITGAGWQTGF